MLDDFCCTAYEHCCVCPKRCEVNRNKGEKGFCGETADLRVAWAGLHFGEEPPITGKGGSGTIFITGCNLACSFCQNFQISHENMGAVVSRDEFSALCLRLQSSGAENINIVTGSHAVPALVSGLQAAKQRGLAIPVLWNTSSYETIESIEALCAVVDGWLPDLKTMNAQLAEQLFAAPDYSAYAQAAIMAMAAHSPLHIDTALSEYPFGRLRSGVIVRHLVLPGCTQDTEAFLTWFAKNLKNKALLSLMTQYTPVERRSKKPPQAVLPERFLTETEDVHLRGLLADFAIDDGFYQELVADDSWLPDFNRVQTFASSLSKPLWHWKNGWVGEAALKEPR